MESLKLTVTHVTPFAEIGKIALNDQEKGHFAI